MIINIKNKIKYGGIEDIFLIKALFFLYKRNKIQPIPISQNLEGIKKYAAGRLVVYKLRKTINDEIVRAPIIRNKFRAPFFISLPKPESHMRNGKRI